MTAAPRETRITARRTALLLRHDFSSANLDASSFSEILVVTETLVSLANVAFATRVARTLKRAENHHIFEAPPISAPYVCEADV
jgi:hypothetical protein